MTFLDKDKQKDRSEAALKNVRAKREAEEAGKLIMTSAPLSRKEVDLIINRQGIPKICSLVGNFATSSSEDP